MAGDSNIEDAINTVKKAIEEDKKQNYEEALKLYKNGIDHFIHVIKYGAQSEHFRQKIRSKCIQYLDRVEKLQNFITQNENSSIKSAKNAGEKGEKGKVCEENRKTKRFEDHLCGEAIEKPSIKWSDVIGLEEAKEALNEAIILPLKSPQLFTTRQPWKGILLYGPCGSGKSYLAKAVATEANNSTFFSSSTLVSEYLGEPEKLVKSLFEMARENKPSIIFIDEVDSLCANDGGSDNRMKTEFLDQMHNARNNNDGIFVLGATNKPELLDFAIGKSFDKKIYIGLPDALARMNMFKLNLDGCSHTLTDDDLNNLSQKSEGYSGADISMVVRDALMQPVRAIQSATHFKHVRRHSPNIKVDDFLLTPCSPDDPAGIEMHLTQVSSEKLVEPILNVADMESALGNIRPTITEK